jgi:hypothetical protein
MHSPQRRQDSPGPREAIVQPANPTGYSIVIVMNNPNNAGENGLNLSALEVSSRQLCVLNGAGCSVCAP